MFFSYNQDILNYCLCDPSTLFDLDNLGILCLYEFHVKVIFFYFAVILRNFAGGYCCSKMQVNFESAHADIIENWLYNINF